jgi:hypothetical protein
MADVTISNLNPGVPKGNDVIPYSTNTDTYKTLVSSITAGLALASQIPSNAQLCKAWVNFDGSTAGNANKTGTYSSTGLSITININNHGVKVGHRVYISYQTGGRSAEQYDVLTVPSINQFTLGSAVSNTSTGNCTLHLQTIRSSYNIANVVRYAAEAGRYIINFDTPFANANYSASLTRRTDANDSYGDGAVSVDGWGPYFLNYNANYLPVGLYIRAVGFINSTVFTAQIFS